jgi:hypothetical protein
MFEGNESPQVVVLGFAFIGLSLRALAVRVRAGTLVTPLGGLHFNVFLFLGVGVTSYLAAGTDIWSIGPERIPAERIISAMLEPLWYLLGAYSVVVLIQEVSARRRKKGRAVVTEVPKGSAEASQLVAVVLAATLVGYFGGTQEVATSGVGTIFIVLRMLQYPVIVFVAATVTLRDPLGMLLAGVTVVVYAYLAIFSPWRSEVIMVLGAVLMGLFMRSRGQKTFYVASMALLVIVVLPFLNKKKSSYAEVSADPVGAFIGTLSLTATERLSTMVSFWATRVNSGREMGYIALALSERAIAHNEGRTYVDAIQQLVPRLLWADKPSFNYRANFYLARDIGLLGWEDDSTSWGVNFFAEGLWNLGVEGLFAVVFGVFLIAFSLDRLVVSRLRHPTVRWFVSTALFFFFFQLVGTVTATTFIVWICIFGFLADWVLRLRAGRPAAIRVALPSRLDGEQRAPARP